MLGWVDAITKESWQCNYLLAKKLFCNDVLIRCIWWLGSHNRSKPAMPHSTSVWETALAACQQPAGRQFLSLVFRAWDVTGWLAGDGLGTSLSEQYYRPCLCWPHPPSGWQLWSGEGWLPWMTPLSAHDNFPELLQDPINLFISWNLTLGHSKTVSNFCGTNHI